MANVLPMWQSHAGRVDALSQMAAPTQATRPLPQPLDSHPSQPPHSSMPLALHLWRPRPKVAPCQTLGSLKGRNVGAAVPHLYHPLLAPAPLWPRGDRVPSPLLEQQSANGTHPELDRGSNAEVGETAQGRSSWTTPQNLWWYVLDRPEHPGLALSLGPSR